MDPATILAIITAARHIIDGVTEQARLLQRQGQITPEQLASIEGAAAASDQKWDDRVAEARARLGL